MLRSLLQLFDFRKCAYFLFVFVFLFLNKFLNAQSYYACGNGSLFGINIPYPDCASDECALSEIGVSHCMDYTFCPNGNLYGLWGNDIYQIDTTTGGYSLIFSNPSGVEQEGCACFQDSIFYSLGYADGLLYVFNINMGTFTLVGPTGFVPDEDIAFFEGEFYFPTPNGIVLLDVVIPSNSTLVVTWPLGDFRILGLTASSVCHILIGRDIIGDQLVAINLIDGGITPLCSIPTWLAGIVSIFEYNSIPTCEVYLDLDCNDSSGAIEADFNSPQFDCLSSPVIIADEDIKILIDDVITEMTIELINPLPDDPNEFLLFNGSVAGISVSGNGTTMITLTNTGGGKIQNFKDALHVIFYNNTSIYPTGGLRTVEVQFSTLSGAVSNIASAYIQVNELPLINVDLGPDQVRCDGETAIFNAGNSGSTFQWSNNATSQSITVQNSGQYIVTVSNGVLCPNQDTVVLDIIPLIHIALDGDTEICDNEPANLILITDTPFPLIVEITPTPGSPFTLTNVTGNYNFTDMPGGTTEYIISNVIPSQPACIEIQDSIQNIEVYSTYEHFIEETICEGDSIFLGYYWETDAGDYEILFHSIKGCDSTVYFTIEVLPAVNISIQTNTCDPAEAGLFITHINNPLGCDTVVQTTVSLLSSDTTLITLSSCNSANTGVFAQLLTNQDGCDSLVITTIAYAISDYTYIYVVSCDSSAFGVFADTLISSFGCDSVLMTTVTMAPSDTSNMSATSCDSAVIGIFQLLLSNQSGCDSLILTTVSPEIPDSTYLYTTSCDSSSLGIFEIHFNSQAGCDSTVFTTVAYAISDYSQVNTSSCDPGEVGVFVDTLINRFGCDSIVTLTVAYAISHNVVVYMESCNAVDTGVFVQTLINQYGCDSTVTLTVAYAISHNVTMTLSSCNPADTGVTVQTWTNQYGCDSIVTSIVAYAISHYTTLASSSCYPADTGITVQTWTNQYGCDSIVIEQTSLFQLPELEIEVTSDFNGYDISCFGENDGSVTADVSGVPPFIYNWSTGDSNPAVTGLLAGSYAVTVTDRNGCTIEGDVILFEPEPFMISFVVSQPDCFDQNNGSITAQQSGGVAPVRYSIDGVNYQSSPTFSGLSGGTYQITSLDANDCEVKEIIWINVPLMVNVELGDDQIITAGDTTIIRAIVNVPYNSLASITWSGIINPNCPTCLTQAVVPIVTTTYSVSVTSVDGCSDEDALTLFLERKTDIYIPNIFSPNGDNFNDRLLISAGSDVEEISLFVIYDRWGNMVYSAEHFQPNDPDRAWDGTFNGKLLNSEVFAYKLIAQFEDGRSEVRYGDVTLLK